MDIVALMNAGKLAASEPLPEYLLRAAANVGRFLHLPSDWLNNGPASQFRMGLPAGFQERLQKVEIGEKLVMYYISRTDQIFFKTFASADRGGYHVSDLKALNPTEEELFHAALWCMTQDVSPEFRWVLKDMLQSLGWQNVSERI